MTEPISAPKVGTFYHFDLTVPNAEEIRDFYQSVAGWNHDPMSMGDYDDYIMKTPGGQPVGGICHARGMNADLPAQWLLYVVVEDLNTSLAKCLELGGKQITPINGDPEQGLYCVIQDPAGAYMSLSQLPAS